MPATTECSTPIATDLLHSSSHCLSARVCGVFLSPSVDAVGKLLQAATMEVIAPGLFRLIAHFSQQASHSFKPLLKCLHVETHVTWIHPCQDSWQAKHAALAAVKQTVEYVEES